MATANETTLWTDDASYGFYQAHGEFYHERRMQYVRAMQQAERTRIRERYEQEEIEF